VDSAYWERRRGGKPQGRKVVKSGQSVADGPGGAARTASEVLEGECKARSGAKTGRETDREAGHWKTPGSTPQGEKGAGGAGKPNQRLQRPVKR
jgi:hypothetical protein